jgi:hypothetical protein
VSKFNQRWGVCSVCHKHRLIKGDLSIDAMVLGKGTHTFLSFDHALCGGCLRMYAPDPKSQPVVNLASRGFVRRLTRKQFEKASRKLARQLKKMQDES